MVQAIILHRLVIEPGAIARLPFRAADHAELRSAATCHVVTSFFQFNSRGAVKAALPTLFLCDLGKMGGSFVFGAFTSGVPATIAGATDFGPAATAFSVLSSSVGTTRSVDVDVRWLNPFPTTPRRAVNAVFGCVFLVFLIPFHFEANIEQLVDVL